MDMYITGRHKDKQSFFRVSIAISGIGFKFRLFTVDMPDETTSAQALVKGLETIQNFCQEHPCLKDNNRISIYQNLVSHNEQYAEPIYKAWEILAKSLGKNVAPFANALEMNAYICDNIDKQMLDWSDGKTTNYRFKKNDILILRRKPQDDETPAQACQNASGFNICARVLSVDREKNIILLDRYQKMGQLQLDQRIQCLSDLALRNYYQPMNKDEMLVFCDGITTILQDPIKSRKLKDKDLALTTCKIVNEKAI